MKPGTFPGVLDPKNQYPDVLSELKGYNTRIGADQTVWATHIDQLRNRVDVGSGPDKVLSFTGTGLEVSIPHGLVDGTGAGITPRWVNLRSFSKLTDFEWRADATNVYVIATMSATGKIEVYI